MRASVLGPTVSYVRDNNGFFVEIGTAERGGPRVLRLDSEAPGA